MSGLSSSIATPCLGNNMHMKTSSRTRKRSLDLTKEEQKVPNNTIKKSGINTPKEWYSNVTATKYESIQSSDLKQPYPRSVSALNLNHMR